MLDIWENLDFAFLLGQIIGIWIFILFLGFIFGLFGIWKLGKKVGAFVICCSNCILWLVLIGANFDGNNFTEKVFCPIIALIIGTIIYVLVNVRNKNINN